MASRRTVRAAAAQPSPVTTPQAQSTAAAMEPCPFALAVSLVLAASLVVTAGWSSAAHAQAAEGQTGSAPAAQAQADDVRQYDIPAGPLSEVLTRFSTESGIFLGGATDLAEGKGSPGLQGQYSVEQALRTLLSGSGLSYRFAGENRVTLVAAQEGDGPLRTGPILVGGDAASGTGPVEGFRAETSSSATNVDAPLIETPATVNVLTRDFIDTIGARRIEEMLQYVPGASAQFEINTGTGFNLRGFSVSAFGGGNGSDNIFIDGFRPGAHAYHFDPDLYERIDILKGPSGLLYGTAAPGGTVRFVTKAPQFEATHRIEGTAGSFDTFRGLIDSTGPLNDDKTLAYRVIVSGQDANLTQHGRNDDNAFDERLIFNPQVTWLTSGGGELGLSYEYSQHDSPNNPGIARLNDGSFTFNTRPFIGPDAFLERTHHIGKATFTQPLSEDWSVHLGGNTGRTDVDSLLDGTLGGTNAANQRTRFTRRFTEEAGWHDIRAELRGRFHTGEAVRHDITIGVSHFDADNVNDAATVSQPGAIDATNPVFGPAPATGPKAFFVETVLTESAFYLQDYISIGDHLKVFGGLRYVDAETEFNFMTSPSAGAETALDYSIGAIYNANHWLNPFVSYSTALTPQTGELVGGGTLPFREGQQIEIGNKSEWLDGRLATTLSLFQIEQTNIAEFIPGSGGLFELSGDQRVRGVEFETVGKITDQFSVIGGYSYLDAEFTAGASEGITPHSVPKHEASLFGMYEFSGALSGLRAGLGVVHVAERFGDNTGTFELPTYERVDAFVGYQADKFDLSLSVANLLDKDYIEGATGFGARFSQGSPRFFTFKVGYEF